MSSDYQRTEYNRSERLLARLTDIYASARHFHSSHKQIQAELADKIYQTQDYAKLTRYHRGLFAGMHRALFDALYRYDLEWRVFYAGRLIPCTEVPTGEWSKVEADKGNHVWLAAPERIF